MQRIPALDGLRGVAILLVLISHYLLIGGGGPAGVGLFFVLSGFLITTLLLEEIRTTGTVSLRRFYTRRFRRLFPALAGLLVIYLLVQAAQGANELPRVILTGFYASNFIDAFTPSGLGGALAPLWSLALEEQFYLVWPCLLVLLMKTRRPMVVITGMFLAVLLYRVAIAAWGAPIHRLYFGPDTASAWLLGGAVLAMLRAHWPSMRVPEPLPIIGYVIVLVAFFTDPWLRIMQGYLPVVFICGSAILVAAAVTPTRMAQLLSVRPLVGLGRISYSLYLWHLPLLVVFGWQLRMVALPVSIAVATLSYRYIEQPFRQPRQPHPVALPAMATS
jgi:peptidoglycan/LPS O-acetylase OafA/YrhL